MKSHVKRFAVVVAALAAASSALVLSNPASALPLPANTPSSGTPTISGPGTLNTPYALQNIPNEFCTLPTSAGYTVKTFMTPQNPAILTYTGNLPNGTGFTQPLYNSAGSPAFANTGPATTVPLEPRGRITSNGSTTGFQFPFASVPVGVYNIGYACVLAGEVTSFYTTPITFTTATTWVVGAAPAAPVITNPTQTVAGTTVTVNFTHAVSTPATTGYTVTVTPSSGPAIPDIALPPLSTSVPLTGLVLGRTYTVSIVATNGQVSPASNTATISVVAVGNAPIPLTVADPFEKANFVVSWTLPAVQAGVPAPTDYNLVLRTRPGGVVVRTINNVVGLTTTVTVPAMTDFPVGDYSATVTPSYTVAGVPVAGLTATPGVANFSVKPNTLVVQEITVTRPPGALILTQRCGVYGPMNSFTGVDAFPGFPVRPAAPGSWTGILAGETASANQAGTSPDINLGAAGVQVDPEFGNYPEPQPPTYPTECGLSMGTARFVTSGNLAGQFYTASGRLNQVTVLDTRDTDTGWIARGDIEDNFTGTTGNTFSGDYLGWIPQVTDTSDPVGGSAYDQVVTPGSGVLPGTVNGLRGNPILGESPLNAGLGIATMDARMQLLIPASADAAAYSATLSLTVVPRPAI